MFKGETSRKELLLDINSELFKPCSNLLKYSYLNLQVATLNRIQFLESLDRHRYPSFLENDRRYPVQEHVHSLLWFDFLSCVDTVDHSWWTIVFDPWSMNLSDKILMVISVDVQEMSHILKTRGEGLKQESFICIPQTAFQKSIHRINHIIWTI